VGRELIAAGTAVAGDGTFVAGGGRQRFGVVEIWRGDDGDGFSDAGVRATPRGAFANACRRIAPGLGYACLFLLLPNGAAPAWVMVPMAIVAGLGVSVSEFRRARFGLLAFGHVGIRVGRASVPWDLVESVRHARTAWKGSRVIVDLRHRRPMDRRRLVAAIPETEARDTIAMIRQVLEGDPEWDTAPRGPRRSSRGDPVDRHRDHP
jgi:hypothetical protein